MMDTAVKLVNAYLQVNGYLTVTEYPLIELKHGSARMATDLDVIAFRFPDAGHEVRSRGRLIATPVSFRPDPVIGGEADKPDMIVGEVKEGQAGFNLASSDPLVLASGLARFGCCEPGQAKEMAQELVRKGKAKSPHGHNIRMVAFGSRAEAPARWHIVSTTHILEFLTGYINDHWSTLRQTSLKNETLSLLALIRKSGLTLAGERDE